MDNNGLPILCKALAFASHKHSDQRRKDSKASPYINHPISLTDVLANEGDVTDINVICGALLHDTVEDTDTTFDELLNSFGKTIADIVMEVSDDKSLTKAKRKQLQIDHAPHKSNEAKLVKLADKICNLRDITHSPPADWDTKRKQQYFDWAKQVVDGIRGTNSKLEKVFDDVYDLGIN